MAGLRTFISDVFAESVLKYWKHIRQGLNFLCCVQCDDCDKHTFKFDGLINLVSITLLARDWQVFAFFVFVL